MENDESLNVCVPIVPSRRIIEYLSLSAPGWVEFCAISSDEQRGKFRQAISFVAFLSFLLYRLLANRSFPEGRWQESFPSRK